MRRRAAKIMYLMADHLRRNHELSSAPLEFNLAGDAPAICKVFSKLKRRIEMIRNTGP
jgi:hypothetical protein